jgi:hypothetical protein
LNPDSGVYFSPPPAGLAEPFAELAGLFLPAIELALLVPPVWPLIVFVCVLRGFASAAPIVRPAMSDAAAKAENNFFI